MDRRQFMGAAVASVAGVGSAVSQKRMTVPVLKCLAKYSTCPNLPGVLPEVVAVFISKWTDRSCVIRAGWDETALLLGHVLGWKMDNEWLLADVDVNTSTAELLTSGKQVLCVAIVGDFTTEGGFTVIREIPNLSIVDPDDVAWSTVARKSKTL